MNFQKFLLFERKKSGLISVILVFFQLFILCSEAYYLDNDPYRHKQILGSKASYVVEWSINWKESSITFQVSAQTKGWVGFGLSRDGRMTGSDVVIGGVAPNGKPYFDDAHVLANRSVEIDRQQDWILIGAWEKGNRTYLTIKRPFETCDPDDYSITKDLTVMIWAYGETDEVQYHMKRRGSNPVYLLDPEISDEIAHHHYRQIGPHSNLYLVQRWALTNSVRLAPKPTSVWCSIQRGPKLALRHDIVGMGAFLPTRLARKHVQQMRVFKCTSPQQTDAKSFFEPYAKLKGEECYLSEKRTFPLGFCRELLYVYGRGGKPFYFPEDIGIPIGESQAEFFLLETTYDNYKTVPNMEIEAGVEIIFSHRQKQNAASLLQIGYGPFGTFMIPPKSTMEIHGSCGSSCTQMMFPKGGVNAFAALLQTRSLGRRIRLQHFRGSDEQPWILKDDNYDSEYQQIRLLNKRVLINPGDQLTTHCTYDSHSRNRTSFSGFSSQDETCTAYVYISNKIPFFRCTSEYPHDKLLGHYGIRNFTWDLVWQERYVTEPKELEGTWLGDVIDHKAHSRSLNPEELEREYLYSPHLESCPDINDIMSSAQSKMFRTYTNDWKTKESSPIDIRTPYLSSTVTYPTDVKEYHDAPFHCKYRPSYEHPPPAHGHDHDNEPPRFADYSPPASPQQVKVPVIPPPTRRPPPLPPRRPYKDQGGSGEEPKSNEPKSNERPFFTSFEEQFFRAMQDHPLRRPSVEPEKKPNPNLEIYNEEHDNLESPRQSRRPPAEKFRQDPIPSPPSPPPHPNISVRPSGEPLPPLRRPNPHHESSRERVRPNSYERPSSKERVRPRPSPSPPLRRPPPPPPPLPDFMEVEFHAPQKSTARPRYPEEVPYKNSPTPQPLTRVTYPTYDELPPKSQVTKSPRPLVRPTFHDDEIAYASPTPSGPSPRPKLVRPSFSAEEAPYRPPPARKPTFSAEEAPYRPPPARKPNLQYLEEQVHKPSTPKPKPPAPFYDHKKHRYTEDHTYRTPTHDEILRYFEDPISLKKPAIQYFEELPVQKAPAPSPSPPPPPPPPTYRPSPPPRPAQDHYKRPGPDPIQYYDELSHNSPKSQAQKKPAVHYSDEAILRDPPRPSITNHIEEPWYEKRLKAQASPPSQKYNDDWYEKPKKTLKSPPSPPSQQYKDDLDIFLPQQPEHNEPQPAPERPRQLKRPNYEDDYNLRQYSQIPSHTSQEKRPATPPHPRPTEPTKKPRTSAEVRTPFKNPSYQPLEESPRSREPIQKHPIQEHPKPHPQAAPQPRPQLQPKPNAVPLPTPKHNFDIKALLSTGLFNNNNKQADLTIPLINKNALFGTQEKTVPKDIKNEQSFLSFFENLANLFSPQNQKANANNKDKELLKTLSDTHHGISYQDMQIGKRSGDDGGEESTNVEEPKPASKNNIKLLILQQTKY